MSPAGTFAQIGTATTASFGDTGLATATTYRYQVRASDAGDNLSGYSNVASATTPDTQAPTAPSTLTATAASSSAINLTWTAATDNVGVTSYLIERCAGVACSNFAQIGTATTASFGDTGLATATTYRYQVRATDAAANLSGYSNVASATTPDTQAPTAPSTLTATAASSSAINLTWTAATDNVGVTSYLIERCAGVACSTFAQIGTATTASFGDTGLATATTYRYQVRATDAAANLSGYSSVATATTPDTQAPTAPSTLTATAASSSAINLTWTAATDNVGVTSYLIERCAGVACRTFAQIGTATTASFGDTGLATATTYRYQVRATDAAANLSGYSSVATATTPAPPDTQAPTTPGAVSGAATSSSQVSLTWTASSDNVGVAGYRVSRDSNLVATVTTLSYADSGLTASTTYTYSVVAFDAAGNPSAPATTSVTTQAASTTPPSSDDFNRANESPIGGNWSAWTGLGTLRLVSNEVATSGADADAGARWSGNSFGEDQFSQITITASDGTPDSGPAVRIASGALTGYFTTSHNPNLIYIHKFAAGVYTELGTTAGQYGIGDVVKLEAIDDEVCVYVNVTEVVHCETDGTPLSGGAPGIFMYDSGDRADDWSGGDVSATVTAPDTLTATAASPSAITLTWTAATGPLGVTGYLIERCQGAGCTTFAQIGTATTTSFGDTGLTTATTYRYRVRATDAGGNLSGYSNVATATTLAEPDTQAPSAPGTLTATAASSSAINLTWTAATDNVGVTSYLIERCAGVACSTFAQIGTATTASFGDTGLATATTYRYQVRATDAAANLSGYSSVASATTSDTPDTQAPTTPGAVSGTATSSSQVSLTWTASSDNVGVAGYRVSRDSNLVATVTTLSYADSGLTASTTYTYSVVAFDAAGNPSAPATTSVTTQAASTTPPSSDDFNRANESPIGGNWSAWTGLGTLRLVSNEVATSGADADAGARWSGNSFGEDQFSQITITASDGTPDSGPAVRIASGALTGYFTTSHNPNLIYIHKFAAGVYTELGTTAGQYSIGDVVKLEAIDDEVCVYVNVTEVVHCETDGTPLSGGAPGIFMYDSGDRADDWSGGDVSATVTAPGALTATAASESAITLTWTAATGPLGVTGYLIERCQGAGCTTFAQIGTATTTSFGDTGLTTATTYRYRVSASDAGGNLSGYSNLASATTLAGPDTQAPTAPGTPIPVVITSTQINLSWAASSDNLVVTGYVLERCQGAGCSNFAQIATPPGTSFNDTGLSASTSYRYRVRATDAAANLSAYSGEATGTTGAPGAYPPVFVSEVHSSTDGCCGPEFNNATLTLDVTGTDRLLIVTWHSEWDGMEPRTIPIQGPGASPTMACPEPSLPKQMATGRRARTAIAASGSITG